MQHSSGPLVGPAEQGQHLLHDWSLNAQPCLEFSKKFNNGFLKENQIRKVGGRKTLKRCLSLADEVAPSNASQSTEVRTAFPPHLSSFGTWSTGTGGICLNCSVQIQIKTAKLLLPSPLVKGKSQKCSCGPVEISLHLFHHLNKLNKFCNAPEKLPLQSKENNTRKTSLSYPLG